MNDFLISGVESQIVGGDLSFGSLGKAEVYLLASWARSALETDLLMSVESSLQEGEIWLKPEVEGSLDILMGEGRKALMEEVGEEGGEFVSVIKFDTMDVMFKY